MKRTLAIAAVGVLAAVAIILHTHIKDFLWAHPWLHSTLVALPTIALATLTWLQSGQNARLSAQLDEERNKQLGRIAKNTEKPMTPAERNAETLRRYLRAKAVVTEGAGNWGDSAEIVEVSDDNIATLFTPRGNTSSRAWCVRVRCDEIEITEIPQGSCPVRLKVLKRYGPDVQLGEITSWEERLQGAANPTFVKGGAALHAIYSKSGSPERRSLYVYASADGANSFLLEASTGQTAIGDNKEVSKRFMLAQIEYEAEGFERASSGSGGSSHRLFVR